MKIKINLPKIKKKNKSFNEMTDKDKILDDLFWFVKRNIVDIIILVGVLCFGYFLFLGGGFDFIFKSFGDNPAFGLLAMVVMAIPLVYLYNYSVGDLRYI